MDIAKFKEMTKTLVIDPMTAFIEEDGGEGYTLEDIRKCESLIHSYLDALGKLKWRSNRRIMKQVKILVLALNDLNEATDYSMIETMEREAIWEVIQTSAVACGLTDAPDDVTEEWRDW